MCFTAEWNAFAGRNWPAGRGVENPDIDDEEEWWLVTAHTIVGAQHQRWTVVIQLRRCGHNLLSRNTVTWRPARGTRQHRTPTTPPPKLFTRNPAIYFPEVEKTCVYVLGMLSGFLWDLLESGNLFCSAAATTNTVLGIIKALVQFLSRHFAMHFSWEAKQRDATAVGSFTPVSLFVYGDDQLANLSVPFQTVMPLDAHESAKPSGVLSSPNSLSNFS